MHLHEMMLVWIHHRPASCFLNNPHPCRWRAHEMGTKETRCWNNPGEMMMKRRMRRTIRSCCQSRNDSPDVDIRLQNPCRGVRTTGWLRLRGHEAKKGAAPKAEGARLPLTDPPSPPQEKMRLRLFFSWKRPHPPGANSPPKPEFSLLCTACRHETSRGGQVWLITAYLHARAGQRGGFFLEGGTCRIPTAPRLVLNRSLSPPVILFLFFSSPPARLTQPHQNKSRVRFAACPPSSTRRRSWRAALRLANKLPGKSRLTWGGGCKGEMGVGGMSCTAAPTRAEDTWQRSHERISCWGLNKTKIKTLINKWHRNKK